MLHLHEQLLRTNSTYVAIQSAHCGQSPVPVAHQIQGKSLFAVATATAIGQRMMLPSRLCSRQCSRRIRRIDCQSLHLVVGENKATAGPNDVGHHANGGARRQWSSSLSSRATAVAPPPLNYYQRASSLHQNCLGSTRHFAIKQSKRSSNTAQQKKEDQAKQNKTLVNEKLVTAIMENNNTISAAEVQVRVTADPLVQVEEGKPKKEAQIMTLQEAIQQAVAEQKDLVGIAVEQEVPVLTLSSWESLQYKSEKLTRERRRNTALLASSVLKETTFKVGIADHDLTRKVDDIIEFLSKGHSCQIVVKAPRRYALKDPASARNMADRVLGMIEDNGGELVREMVMNEEQTQAKFLIRPRKL